MFFVKPESNMQLFDFELDKKNLDEVHQIFIFCMSIEYCCSLTIKLDLEMANN